MSRLISKVNKIKFKLLLSSMLILGLGCLHLYSSDVKGKEIEDINTIKCGNLIYAGTKSSVCFADRFLTRVSTETTLNPAKKFSAVKLGSEDVFKYPFAVFSGEDSFALTIPERENLIKYLKNGGFILASPGCSDKKWDASFRSELKICFPDLKLDKINMSHQIFSTVYTIPTLNLKHGGTALLEGLEFNGRIVLIYSKEGLNDVDHAKGCCCCGGDQINECEKVNVNIFTYALLN